MPGNISHLFLIIVAALCSVVGNSLFRLGLIKTGIESLSPAYLVKNFLSVVFQPFVFAGFVAYAISAVIWLRVLSTEPLNKSYPVLTAFAILFLVAGSIIFLREPITLVRVAGMALIVFGAFLVFARV